MTGETTEQEELQNLAAKIEELQHATNSIVRRRELSSTFHPLNVLDIGLFNLLIMAKLAVGQILVPDGRKKAND